ncbi:fructosamine kinase family protein [Phycicoccus sp. BSK3Z-2]|uniref:Fructosamine kinase family protein n=1 Tax=Phycicoccus avicenniae TaxID=2828860 RepID=A0A941I0P3_9MICO|nr:fructosamine kinase family protein [Phycicoccus avicenniae]MBR7744322.1 fructosamine kinase family protein [Phycicoccus avicenniae]
MARTHRKSARAVPDGYFAWEAAGLRWLAVTGGAPVAEVLDVGDTHLDLPFLDSAPPTPAAAEEFGRRLAATHAAGAAGYGAAPRGWDGDGWLGPLSEPLPLRLGRWEDWGTFYAQARIEPLVRMGRDRGTYDASDAAVLGRCADAVASGRFDTGEEAARLHGDLWSGNVMWTEDGVTLIDPAAHGGHREADLAMLALFGAPHLDRTLAAYDEASPLARGWPERVALHQLHPLVVHAVLFGGPYVSQSVEVARRFGAATS